MHGQHARGMTVVDWLHRGGSAANADIVLGVDHERFYALVERGLRGA
jgi:inosine-uridine nucleoside N-ribohydrolase